MADEPDTETRLASLEARVGFLEASRPGKKARPILVSEEHVCGIDPTSDSPSCPFASLYYRQQGCKGDRCTAISSAYWQQYNRERRRAKE